MQKEDLPVLSAKFASDLSGLFPERIFGEKMFSCKTISNLDRTGQGWWVQSLYFEMIWNRSQGYEGNEESHPPGRIKIF